MRMARMVPKGQLGWPELTGPLVLKELLALKALPVLALKERLGYRVLKVALVLVAAVQLVRKVQQGYKALRVPKETKAKREHKAQQVARVPKVQLG